MLLKSNVASHINSTLTFYSSLGLSLKAHFADGYFWQDPKSQYVSLCWAGRRDRNSACVSESTILKSQEEKEQQHTKPGHLQKEQEMNPASGASVRQWGGQGWGQPLLRTVLIQQIDKTLSFRVSFLIRTRCLWISQRHYSFSLGSSLWKGKKKEFTKAFSIALIKVIFKINHK